MNFNLNSQERNDIALALRDKANGDRSAAKTIPDDAGDGLLHLRSTLLMQADRQEKLADRIEE